MTACPIRYQRQVPDRKGKIFYTSITSLSHISKGIEDIIQHTTNLLKLNLMQWILVKVLTYCKNKCMICNKI